MEIKLKIFENPYFTKTCKNCSYRSWFFGFDCLLSGNSCRSERKYGTRCGVDYKGWKPNKKAFKEYKKLKKSHPEIFV